MFLVNTTVQIFQIFLEFLKINRLFIKNFIHSTGYNYKNFMRFSMVISAAELCLPGSFWGPSGDVWDPRSGQ